MLKLIPQARSFSLHGAIFEALASPSTGSQETSAWIVSIAPSTQGTPHSVTREEIFIALQGTARVRSEGREYLLAAGGAMIVPPHIEFVLENATDETFRAVAILPVGGQARLADGAAFSPPWTQ